MSLDGIAGCDDVAGMSLIGASGRGGGFELAGSGVGLAPPIRLSSDIVMLSSCLNLVLQNRLRRHDQEVLWSLMGLWHGTWLHRGSDHTDHVDGRLVSRAVA